MTTLIQRDFPMSKMIEFTLEQTHAYNRFILARNKLRGKKWIRASTISHCVDVAGVNHPAYLLNDEYVEYIEAFKQWLAVEPRFRHDERMRSSRGDYGSVTDSWEEKL